MVVTLVILAAAAALVVPLVDSASEDAAATATRATLSAMRDAVLGDGASPGFAADMGTDPGSSADLLRRPSGAPSFDPSTAHGWRGPYVRCASVRYVIDGTTGFAAEYGASDDPFPADAWGRPVVLQIPDADGVPAPTADETRHARLVSAGADGVLQTPRTPAGAAPGTALLPARSACGDDLVLFLRVADTRVD